MVVFGKNIRLATDAILSAIVRISYLWTEFPPVGLNVLKISLKIHVKKNCLVGSLGAFSYSLIPLFFFTHQRNYAGSLKDLGQLTV